MRLPEYLPHDGFHGQRKLALRSKLGTFLVLSVHWVNQLHSTIGTRQQTKVNIRAAIAAFGIIIFGSESEAGITKIHFFSSSTIVN